MSLTYLYRMLIPQKIRALFHLGKYCDFLQESYYIRKNFFLQKRALNKLKKKDKIKCVFLGLFSEIWKYDYVYKIGINPNTVSFLVNLRSLSTIKKDINTAIGQTICKKTFSSPKAN